MSGTHSNQFFKSWRETIKIFTFDSTVHGYICISHDHCCHVHVTHGHHTHSQNFFIVNKCPHCPNIPIVPLNVFAARQQNTILNDLLGGVGAPMMPTSVPWWCPHLCPDNSHITSWNPTNSLLNRKNIRISKSLKSSRVKYNCQQGLRNMTEWQHSHTELQYSDTQNDSIEHYFQ